MQKAENKINKLENKKEKLDLNNELNKAKLILKTQGIATKDVSALLKDGALNDDVTSLQIEKAKKIVDGLTDKSLQKNLQKTLEMAANQLTNQINATNVVNSLFADNTHISLAPKLIVIYIIRQNN